MTGMMAQIEAFKAGARVGWKAKGRKVTGEVLRVVTCKFALSSAVFEASAETPRLLVRRDDTGALVSLSPRGLHLA
jgi:Hypervirulence associated proteins TUDOR domain